MQSATGKPLDPQFLLDYLRAAPPAKSPAASPHPHAPLTPRGLSPILASKQSRKKNLIAPRTTSSVLVLPFEKLLSYENCAIRW
jgi:hypothetical protein